MAGVSRPVDDPEALPWHAKLRGGTVQVTDLRGGVLGAIFGTGDTANTGSPSANAQRTVLGQWDVEPATDADELELLHLAYKKVVSPWIEGVDAEIRFEIWQLAATYEFAAGTKTILEIMQDAVHDRFTELIAGLGGRSISADIATQTGDELRQAEASLRWLIESQHTYNLPKSKNDLALMRLVMHLTAPSMPDETAAPEAIKTPEIPRPPQARETPKPPPRIEAPHSDVAYFSEEENEYVLKFNHHVEQFISHIRRAVQILPKSDEFAEIRNEIRYMDEEKRLRCLIQSLNAVRADRINRVNKLLLSWDGSVPESSYFFADQQRFLQFILSRKYLVPPVKGNLQPRNPGLSDQAQAKVEKLKDLISADSPFLSPWFGVGPRRRIPHCDCYVGHYRGGDCDLYLWVLPQDMSKLRQLAVIISALAPLERQDVFAGRGAAFSPGLK